MTWIGVALTYSLLGGIHCAGMCGGFAMISLGRHPDGGNLSKNRFFSLGLWTYLAGKTASYGVLGLGLGLAGELFHTSPFGAKVLALGMGIVLVVTGFQLGGFRIRGRQVGEGQVAGRQTVESLDTPQKGKTDDSSKNFTGWSIQSWIAHQMGKVVSKAGSSNRFLLGALNGLLPCGLLYAALAYATSLANPATSTLFMLIFGLGTFPALILAAALMSWLRQSVATQTVRVSGIIIILTGIVTIARAFLPMGPMLH